MRSTITRTLAAAVAAGVFAGGAAVASTSTAVAAPTHSTVAVSHHAAPKPDPTKTPKHKKCPKGEHYTKVNGKWACHKTKK
ncbi:hypothetical protein ABZ589_34785 [Streptomyces sp. NPDC013313]|uniref:hypothetical protein n=1 Tax=Streptomyces sp. NPDC013313 TaxID=3155603 RepID=UPI0033CF4E17